MKDSTAKRWKTEQCTSTHPRETGDTAVQSERSGLDPHIPPLHPHSAPPALLRALPLPPGLRPKSVYLAGALPGPLLQTCVPAPALPRIPHLRRRPISLRPHLSPHLQETAQSRAPQRLPPGLPRQETSAQLLTLPSPVTALNPCRTPDSPQPRPTSEQADRDNPLLKDSGKLPPLDAGTKRRRPVTAEHAPFKPAAAPHSQQPQQPFRLSRQPSPFKSHSTEHLFLQALPDPQPAIRGTLRELSSLARSRSTSMTRLEPSLALWDGGGLNTLRFLLKLNRHRHREASPPGPGQSAPQTRKPRAPPGLLPGPFASARPAPLPGLPLTEHCLL